MFIIHFQILKELFIWSKNAIVITYSHSFRFKNVGVDFGPSGLIYSYWQNWGHLKLMGLKVQAL